MASTEYFVYAGGSFEKMTLRELAEYNHPLLKTWSARLSTGVFGLPHCKAGNRGPKETNEVLLSLGEEGINKFVDLGFLSCSVCHPEDVSRFWEVIKDSLQHKYSISALDDFIDKRKLPFDARRLSWEELLPITGRAPNRIYLPRDLIEQDLVQFQERFTKIGFNLPPIGYYNADAPGRFSEYRLI